MRIILLVIAVLSFGIVSAQQINPIPDYVFKNQMSVGRAAVTDTAAYMSIGPRYGAVKGFMPPMVTDTASLPANKRNGLFIFSIQKNKYLYWDSVGSKWAEMSGTAGAAITGNGVSGYMSEFTTSTNIDSTSFYHSGGKFGIKTTNLSNGIFSVYGGQSYFDTTLKVGTQTFTADESKNEVYINTNTDNGSYALQISGGVYNTGKLFNSSDLLIGSTYNPETSTNVGNITISGTSGQILAFTNGTATTAFIKHTGILEIMQKSNSSIIIGTNNVERIRINNSGGVGIGATGSLSTLTLFNPDTTANILEIRGGGGSSKSKFVLSYGNQTSITDINGTISSSNADFSFRAGSNRYLSFFTNPSAEIERIRIHTNGGLRFIGQSAAPTAEAGTVYYDTDDNKLKVYDGTTWVDLN